MNASAHAHYFFNAALCHKIERIVSRHGGVAHAIRFVVIKSEVCGYSRRSGNNKDPLVLALASGAATACLSRGDHAF
jgi:hypothetical protein